MLIKLYILFTFLLAVYLSHNKQLIVLLLLGVVNTIISTFFREKNISIDLNTNLYILLHTLIWFYILWKSSYKNYIIYCMFLFIALSIINLYFSESFEKINNSIPFIVGAFMYVMFFLIESFSQLHKENLDFFKSNNFILIFSPVAFFIGMSLVFGFKNRTLNDTMIFKGINFYKLINLIVNMIYYSLINIYIFRENKNKNGPY